MAETDAAPETEATQTLDVDEYDGKGSDDKKLSPEMIQKKLYFLLDQLKKMQANVPETYQVRMSYELLTELANTLLSGTIFEIVESLMEIQHVTENHLKTLRDQVENENEREKQDWIIKITDKEELENLLLCLKKKHAKKLLETDMKLVTLLDQKRKDQQNTMNKAGVPGFFETDDPKEIKIQMFLLDFILRLSRVEFDQNKQTWYLPE